MSPVRGGSNDDSYADMDEEGRRAAGRLIGADDDDVVRGTPDVFDAPLEDLKETLSDMTRDLGSLIGKEEEPEAPVAQQADIEDSTEAAESSGMARLAGVAERDTPEVADDPAIAADRIALSLSADDDEAPVEAADAEAPDETDEAFDPPDMMLGQQVLQANLDGDVNDNNIMDKFEDDLPVDDTPDSDDGGLEFASLDFDGE